MHLENKVTGIISDGINEKLKGSVVLQVLAAIVGKHANFVFFFDEIPRRVVILSALINTKLFLNLYYSFAEQLSIWNYW